MEAGMAAEIIHPYTFNAASHEDIEFTELCAVAYGPSLASPDQFQRRMRRVTTLIRLRHHSSTLAGAVALQRSRMIAFATSPDKNLGNRLDMAQMLGSASRQAGMEWCSIGSQHIAMLAIANKLGLTRVTDTNYVEVLLNHDELAHTFIMDSDNHHLPIITTCTSIERKQPYPQQVWAWPLQNNSDGAPTTIRT